MKTMQIMMMVLLLVLGFSVTQAQPNEFFDDDQPQIEDEAPAEPSFEEGESDEVEPPAPPSRFRSRFNRNNNPTSNTNRFNRNNNRPKANVGPTTPVKDIKLKKTEPKSGKNKMSFADAQPEDITDENFPDIIESFDYPNANILDVTKAIAKLTKKNIIIEPGVSGKITIVAPSPVTVAQAWNLYLSALAMNNYTIVPTSKGYLKIRKEGNAKNDSIETYSGAYYPTADQLITRIIQLKYIQAESVKKSLEKFVSKKAGDVSAYENTNSIIISGYGSSVERISRIIEELDKPGFEERLEVIPIRHAKAKDLSELIEKIIKDGDDDKKSSRFSRSRFSKSSGDKQENLKLVEADERTNSLVVVGNQQGVDRIQKLVNRLDYPLDPADAGGVYVYYMKHGEAVKIAETLSGIAEETEKAAEKSNTQKNDKAFTPPRRTNPIFGGNVLIKADENTNSLIITASKQDYQVVKNLLAKIDIAKDQVFVEAVIMEMEASNKDIWNMNYTKFFKSNSANTSAQGEGIARVGFGGGNVGELLNPQGGKGAILNIGDPNETIQINTGAGLVEVPTLLALINFLKEKTNANILSTPNILAMDNEESEIEVGDEVPVANNSQITQTGQTNVGVQFREATILLKIKPFISPDSDIIRLNVEQRINKVSTAPIRAPGLANSTQALTKKSLKTNIVLESGQTAVLGGLMEDSDQIEETKVPLLGDIPVLGWLFRNRTVTVEKTNLVVFLTPNIIRNSSQHRKILQDKVGGRIDWIKKNSGGRDPYGQKFNDLIQDSSASARTYQPNKEEIELDLEDATTEGDEQDDATPLGDDNIEEF